MAPSPVSLNSTTCPNPCGITSSFPCAAGAFTLPALPYAYDFLEPFIDTLTMRLHHDRHFCTFYTNLNPIVAANAALQGKTLVEINQAVGALGSFIPAAVATAVR